MPKIAKEKSALEVARLEKPGLHFIGGVAGLALQITRNGSKSWVLRAMVGSVRREIGLGGYPSTTLAMARAEGRVVRDKIFKGIDPVEERAAAKRALIAQQAKAMTFERAAQEYIRANSAGWRNPKHAAQWKSTIEAYADPVIGKLSVSEIETPHIVKILEPIWQEKPETASRLRGRVEAVLDWARVRGFREGENPARWKGHLASILPPKAKVRRVIHHAALDYLRISAFMVALRKVEGMGARALAFAILTAGRSGEVRGATWREINFQDRLWIIPAERMKAGKEHRVPLPDAAMRVLEGLPRVEGCEYVFPSSALGQLSDMTLTAVTRRMDKFDGGGWRDASGAIVTAHGFRSTFRDWAGETTAHPREVIEQALAHQLKDKAEAAYRRGDALEKRRRLMRDWADYCARPAANADRAVTPIRKEAQA